ncbi:hypothetical protein ACFCQI_02825 [Rhodanobacter sp. FW102-FHT14D06]|uniref:Uncharacterized protein n=2 Tax=unclassified Rhodanobacter TaxID=2621553 RepID=A0AB74UQX9_9GAMM
MLQLADLFRRARMREVERAVRTQFDDAGVFQEDALSLDDALTARTPETFAWGSGVNHGNH